MKNLIDALNKKLSAEGIWLKSKIMNCYKYKTNIEQIYFYNRAIKYITKIITQFYEDI
jgi:hypothetical protein